jgi:8-oxo-dGTP diphosphatase
LRFSRLRLPSHTRERSTRRRVGSTFAGCRASAYDHDLVAEVALERLKAKIQYTNVAYGLLGHGFTLGELQHVYEVIGGRPLDRRNFRKRILDSGL